MYNAQNEISDRANNQFQNKFDDIKDTFNNKETFENDDNIRNSHSMINFDNKSLGMEYNIG